MKPRRDSTPFTFTENERNELKTLDPQFIATIEDRSIGLLGYVVVDSTIQNHACGGLRILNDVTVDELKGLARMMTLKYGFNGMPQGGAKAGIVGDPFMPLEKKRTLLKRFGEILSPVLKTGYYISGTDINTDHQDILYMAACAGLKIPRRRLKNGKNSGFYTALSVMIAAEAAASHRKIDLSKCDVAIEGFGAVGGNLAWLMAKKKGSRVVAVSTSEGALYDPKGLDVDYLIGLKETHGGRFISHAGRYEKIGLDELLLLDIDILFPCARHHSIYAGNALKIQAPIICPGANIPVTREADRMLFQKGVISIPSFVANSGGVMGNKIEMMGMDKGYIESFFRRKIHPRILNLIRLSEERRESMLPIAERYAMQRFRLMQNASKKGSVLKSYARKVPLKMLNEGLIPEFLTKRLGPSYFQSTLLNDPPFS